MIKFLRCLFWGHSFRFLSRTKKGYDRLGDPTNMPYMVDEIRTVFLYQCDCCCKMKTLEVKANFGEISADDLIQM